MPSLQLNGITLTYQQYGTQGPAVVLTPGGRWAGHVHAVVATELAQDCRVITWDRRNTDGGSSLALAGEQSEADLHADDLAALIQALDLGPCFVGEYAGCRTSPLLAFKYPQLVRGLMLAWPSGEDYAAERLPRNAYRKYIRAALRGGMEAVAQITPFAETLQHNPANREALLSMSVRDFVRQMAWWEVFFTTSGDLPVAGCRLNDHEWSQIGVPACITGGCDPVHPTTVAERLRRLLNCRLYHEPVMTRAEWDDVFDNNPYPVTSRVQGARIAPVWRRFIQESL